MLVQTVLLIIPEDAIYTDPETRGRGGKHFSYMDPTWVIDEPQDV